MIASFKIGTSEIVNPIIKVALFKKKELTAYNQEYVEVNLNDHISNKLSVTTNNEFLVPNDIVEFNLNFIKDIMENNGYKVIFTLYDGDAKVAAIAHNFIVR